jgi:hypothetical protein
MGQKQSTPQPQDPLLQHQQQQQAPQHPQQPFQQQQPNGYAASPVYQAQVSAAAGKPRGCLGDAQPAHAAAVCAEHSLLAPAAPTSQPLWRLPHQWAVLWGLPTAARPIREWFLRGLRRYHSSSGNSFAQHRNTGHKHLATQNPCWTQAVAVHALVQLHHQGSPPWWFNCTSTCTACACAGYAGTLPCALPPSHSSSVVPAGTALFICPGLLLVIHVTDTVLCVRRIVHAHALLLLPCCCSCSPPAGRDVPSPPRHVPAWPCLPAPTAPCAHTGGAADPNHQEPSQPHVSS